MQKNRKWVMQVQMGNASANRLCKCKWVIQVQMGNASANNG